MNTTIAIKKLEAAKKKQATTEKELGNLEGQIEYLKTRLKEFGVKTIQAAQKKLDSMDDELNKLEKELETKLDELEGYLEVHND
jgi:septal ring factor EnvC (AmiA/AmiB activator)